MSLRDVPFDSVSERSLQALVENQVRESMFIDYKRELPDKADEKKREFLKDVTAFANAEGGDLLYGVEEKDGVPSKLVGVPSGNLDTEVQRLSSLLRDAVDPRPHGVRIRLVSLAGGNVVVLVRVPRSLEAPHMVAHGNYRQFFTRNPSGNHSMSSNEVRMAVLKTEDWKTRSAAWRRDRVALITSNEGPCLLSGEGVLVIHVVPMQPGGLDLSDRRTLDRLSGIRPSGASGWNHRLSFDGFLVAPELPGTGVPSVSYRLWFHDSRAEFVRGGLIMADQRGARRVSGGLVENQIEEAVRTTVDSSISGYPSPPLLVFVALCGVKGARMSLPEPSDPLGSAPFDRPELLLPPLLVEETPPDWWSTLAPVINRLWQAAGLPRSPSLAADGSRIQR